MEYYILEKHFVLSSLQILFDNQSIKFQFAELNIK